MDRKLNAVIVDDDESARNILEKFLEIADNVNIIGNVATTANAYELIIKSKPDVIFLDINITGDNGLVFAQKLRAEKIDILIVFTTAYSDYAAQAFSVRPLDYLLKPFGVNDIFDVVTKIEKTIDAKVAQWEKEILWGYKIPEKLKFKVKGGYFFCFHADLVYLKTTGAFSSLYMKSGEVIKVMMSVNEIYEVIKHLNFIRLNRSVIINMNFLTKYEKKLKKCFLQYKDEEIGFPVTQRSLKNFESMKSVKLA